jgi:cell division protein FtsQ
VTRRLLAEQLVRERRERRRRLLRGGALAFAVMLVGAAVVAVLADRLFHPETLGVEQIAFEGEFRRVSPEQIKQAVMPAIAGNMLALDLERIEAAAKAVPWVREVSVRKRWPSGVYLRVTEQQPIVRWGERDWLNESGEVIHAPAPANGVEPELVRLSGPDDRARLVLERYRAFRPRLELAGLALARLDLGAGNTWTLGVQDAGGAHRDLVLGSRDLEERLNRFLRVYRHDPALFASATRIDLRYPNGFSIRREEIHERQPA